MTEISAKKKNKTKQNMRHIEIYWMWIVSSAWQFRFYFKCMAFPFPLSKLCRLSSAHTQYIRKSFVICNCFAVRAFSSSEEFAFVKNIWIFPLKLCAISEIDLTIRWPLTKTVLSEVKHNSIFSLRSTFKSCKSTMHTFSFAAFV